MEFINPIKTYKVTPLAEKVEGHIRCQFPLTLSYALTFHKVQGLTLSKICELLNDLYILCENENPLESVDFDNIRASANTFFLNK